jgi:ABC-type nickel/cobalt efflux system permease component RcnA
VANYGFGHEYRFGAIIILIFARPPDLFWTSVGVTLLTDWGTAITVAAIATVAVSARQAASRIAKSRAGIGTLATRAIGVSTSVLVVAVSARCYWPATWQANSSGVHGPAKASDPGCRFACR